MVLYGERFDEGFYNEHMYANLHTAMIALIKSCSLTKKQYPQNKAVSYVSVTAMSPVIHPLETLPMSVSATYFTVSTLTAHVENIQISTQGFNLTRHKNYFLVGKKGVNGAHRRNTHRSVTTVLTMQWVTSNGKTHTASAERLWPT